MIPSLTSSLKQLKITNRTYFMKNMQYETYHKVDS